MKKLDIHPSVIPYYKILFVATSYPDYEMDRVILVEDYPDYGEYVVFTGGHCSCYEFDETKWDAIHYNKSELKELMKGWLEKGYGSEKIIAPLVLNHLREDFYG